jgi:hypothetical protein
MLFGLVSLATLVIAAMAVDFGRTINIQNRLLHAADAAVLAAGRALLDGDQSVDQIRMIAENYFFQNAGELGNGIAMTPPSVSVDPVSGEVKFDALAKIDMRLVQLAGFAAIDVPVTAAAVFRNRDIEIGIALDITGSMAEHVGATRKIDAMKEAVHAFVDNIVPADPNNLLRVRVGLAPYAASINIGEFADAAADGRSDDGCVVERMGNAASDDFGPYHVINDGRRGSYRCPSEPIVPLTADRDMLHQQISALQPSGSTAGHIGIQWAWNIVSEHWGATWGGSAAPDPYSRVDEGKLLKAVILMTDGEFNTKYHGPPSATQATALCEAMKAKGITVFAVGFGLGNNRDAIATLRACASEGADYFADAATAGDLQSAFQKFAGKLSELRLTH